MGTSLVLRITRLLWFVFSTVAVAAVDGPGVHQFIHAARTTEPIKLDGVIDEIAWTAAPVFTQFVQFFPDNGAAATERTELRILYDDKYLYVGFVCFDSEPDQIIQRLGRRDKPPASDNVTIGIDSSHDHRTAYTFNVNAAGVLQDAVIYDGTNSTTDWDTVWDARVSRRADGWSVEMAIPLQALRFPKADLQTWGMSAQREITRKHEQLNSVPIPRSVTAPVTRWGHVVLEGLTRRPEIEIAPYVAARATWRPQFSSEDQPHPRLFDPSADVGVDFKVGLNSQLTLNGAINPDFGQVEADQIILNLTTFEQFFPEKRPLFTQGMDLFQGVGAQGDSGTPQQMFYSRRIGLASPILGAAKLTGTIGRGLDIAVLNATVSGGWQREVDETRPNRALRFRWAQPLRFALSDAFPTSEPIPENFFATVVRKRLFSNSTVGAFITSAIPLTGACTAAESALADDQQPASCRARGGNAVAIDWNLRSNSGDWGMLGQIDGSQIVKGPPERTLPDGTALHSGSRGLGGYLTGGKLGGEPFRFDVGYEYESPRLELNAMGFLPRQNRHRISVGTKLFQTEWGSLQNASLSFRVAKNWSADGRGVDTYRGIALNGNAFFPGYHFLGCDLGVDDAEFDIRDVGTGLPLQRRPTHYAVCYTQTDPGRTLSVLAQLGIGLRFPTSHLPRKLGYAGNVRLTIRPHSRLETQLGVAQDLTPYDVRYASGATDGPLVLADLTSEFLSLTLRQLLVITPRLTLQAYGQLFSAYAKYGPFFTPSSSAISRVQFSDLVPTIPTTDPSFHLAAINLNLVLRWEYRLGSALFVVYSRSQSEFPYPSDQSVPGKISYQRLTEGPATDVFLIKWSYWWDV